MYLVFILVLLFGPGLSDEEGSLSLSSSIVFQVFVIEDSPIINPATLKVYHINARVIKKNHPFGMVFRI